MAALLQVEPRVSSVLASGKTKAVIRSLPPFSPVAIRLMFLLRREDIGYREVVDVLKTDAAFSAEILRLANSAAVGSRFKTDSILQALSLLGIPCVSSLSVTLALSRFLKPVSKLPVLRRCWRHNLATAIAASEIACKWNVESGRGYLFGLLHDIGRLGLLVAFPKSYVEISDLCNASGQSLTALELATYGFDHREVGAWVAAQWDLPPDLVDVSLTHGVGGVPITPVSKAVHEACRIANRIGCSVSERPHEDEITQEDPGPLTHRVLEQVNRLEQEYGL
jgi:HD-like signal output (HDOD) protein